jgi:two-component system chemotaxis response regulator CheB
MCVREEPTVIATLLGSCVAVCLFNKALKIAGMNHYMLSHAPPGEPDTGKFGDYATETLIKMMLSYDADLGNINASVVGGGNVVGHLSFGMAMGARNIEVAQEVLKKHRINVVYRDVGGEKGRKLYFESWTGRLNILPIERTSASHRIIEIARKLIVKKIRVLIVDDSEVIRSAIREALMKDPMIEVVAEAANPFEAREALLAFNPDVMCLDIIMPKLDGLTFLKKLFMYRPLPVIIISSVAQAGSKNREQALTLGAVGVFDKTELGMYSRSEKLGEILSAEIKKAAATRVKSPVRRESAGP